MKDLLVGLAFSTPAAVWLAGIAIAVVWLTLGINTSRVLAFLIAVVWPMLPLGMELVAKHRLESAAQAFIRLCAEQAEECIHWKAEAVTAIFVDIPHAMQQDSLFSEYSTQISSRLVLERPGYQEIHVIKRDSDNGGSYAVHPRGVTGPGMPPASLPISDQMARYGVRFQFDDLSSNSVRGFRVLAFDRKTKDLVAEQRSFVYRSPEVQFAGYPLWRQQERTCPLAYPADFVRSALPPQMP
jgi:hypothetical protein